MMARLAGFLPFTREIQVKFLAPGFSPGVCIPSYCEHLGGSALSSLSPLFHTQANFCFLTIYFLER